MTICYEVIITAYIDQLIGQLPNCINIEAFVIYTCIRMSNSIFIASITTQICVFVRSMNDNETIRIKNTGTIKEVSFSANYDFQIGQILGSVVVVIRTIPVS